MDSDDTLTALVVLFVCVTISCIAVQAGMTFRAEDAENAATLRACVEKHSARDCAGSSTINPSLEVR